ncbi:predicted protein [Nematostella vectensis]|uniref:TIR domain-containing protein n=1 Tax=Nematostella vectensis TaxID=45351 RepID=A7RU69_NEMVE|nr:predicted protein [Nematostella vectensis]|eukprot:XP_001637093.1 predicted protein [Nematostella vectensis]
MGSAGSTKIKASNKHVQPFSKRVSNITNSDNSKEKTWNSGNNNVLGRSSSESKTPEKEEKETLEDPLIKLHSEKCPDLKDSFISLHEAINALNTQVDSEGVFLNEGAVSKVMGRVSSVYSKHRTSKSKKQQLGIFLVDIQFPEIVVRIFRIVKGVCPEYLTYDVPVATKAKNDATDDEAGEASEALGERSKAEEGEKQDLAVVQLDTQDPPVNKKAPANKETLSSNLAQEEKNLPESNALNTKGTPNDKDLQEDGIRDSTGKDTEQEGVIGDANNLSNIKQGNSDHNINQSIRMNENQHATNREDKDSTSKEADDDQVKRIKAAQKLVQTATIVTINFSDRSDEFCIGCGEAGLIGELTDMVSKLRDCTASMVKYQNPETQALKCKTQRGKILNTAMGTMHNLSRRIPCRQYFKKADTVKVLLPMLNDEVSQFAAKALLILAYLTDESNNSLIMASEEPIQFLIHILSKSCSSNSNRYLGFTNSELAEGLSQIAVNDSNKKLIGQHGAIPILVDMLANAKNDEQRRCGAEALWVLAFDNENKEAILTTPNAVELLKELQHSEDDSVKKAAAGVLWEIEGKESHTVKESTADEPLRNHVMISYQWDVQPTMIQVKSKLQAAGYRVWMDLEQMGGSTLQAMANAVENAEVVLMCVSQKYKESPNCRSEAEYAFQLRKDIVPLMMEKSYRPDGWLGMIMGAKLWIDFSDKQTLRVDDSFEKLQKEIGMRGRGRGNVVESKLVAVQHDVVDVFPKIDISKWSKDDVMNWMNGFGLRLGNDSTIASHLSGKLLQRLAKLRSESPEFFYSSVKQDFGFAHLQEVLLFVDELNKLVL